jgi:hypothetical protein
VLTTNAPASAPQIAAAAQRLARRFASPAPPSVEIALVLGACERRAVPAARR